MLSISLSLSCYLLSQLSLSLSYSHSHKLKQRVDRSVGRLYTSKFEKTFSFMPAPSNLSLSLSPSFSHWERERLLQHSPPPPPLLSFVDQCPYYEHKTWVSGSNVQRVLSSSTLSKMANSTFQQIPFTRRTWIFFPDGHMLRLPR